MVSGAALLFGGCSGAVTPLRLASTTSVDGSGLLGVLLPASTQAEGIHVDAVGVGSGKALQLGRRGDARAPFVACVDEFESRSLT